MVAKVIISLLLITFLLSCAVNNKSYSTAEQAKKLYSSIVISDREINTSIKDSILIKYTSASQSLNSQTKVICKREDCFIDPQGGSCLFIPMDTGHYTLCFYDRSFGPLIEDTVEINVTNIAPIIKRKSDFVFAESFKPSNLGLEIIDDGKELEISFNWNCDSSIDTVFYNKDFEFNFSYRSQNGEERINYKTALSVKDNDGNITLDTFTTVIVLNPPSAEICKSIIECVLKPVLITGSESEDDNGKIISYLWDINGDNKIDTITNIDTLEWYYDEIQDFAVVLKVMDNDSNISDADTTMVSIIEDSPIITLGAETTIKIGKSLLFNPKARDNCGEVVAFEWDFENDGKFDYYSRNHGRTNHVFKDTGTFLSKFRVEDNHGNISNGIRVIHVIE